MAVRPDLSMAELEVLKLLWAMGPSTARAVNDEARRGGRTWAYTTALTLLQRLRDKGYVAAEASSSGPSHVFRPIATREEVLRDRLDDLADRLCEGAPAPLVLALVRGRRYTAEQIARFRALLDDPALESDATGNDANIH